tara:strand:+ start:231 stop:575 length:345 start_codon:yes stop_codon:yes gene_type:complete
MISTVWGLVDGVYRAKLKGPLPCHPYGAFTQIGYSRGNQTVLFKGFRRWKIRHRQLMGEPFLIDLKRGVHAKNGLSVLNAFDAARRKTPSIAYSIDMEDDGLSHSSWSQKVRMK